MDKRISKPDAGIQRISAPDSGAKNFQFYDSGKSKQSINRNPGENDF